MKFYRETTEWAVDYTQTGCKYCYLMPGKHEYMDPHF